MEWNKKDIMRFISLYHKQSMLWDSEHPDHYNKRRKENAWVEIAQEMGRPVEQCKKKKETLLSSLRREKMKIKRSVRIGKGGKAVYKSNWFAFASLQFMLDKKPTKPDLNTTRLQREVNIQEQDEASIQADSPSDEAISDNEFDSDLGTQGKKNKHTPVQTRKRANLRTFNRNPRLKHACRTAKDIIVSSQDECFHFGNFIAAKLRLYDESTRCAIQNDIMNTFQQANQGRYAAINSNQSCNACSSHNTLLVYSQNRSPNAVPVPLPSHSSERSQNNDSSQNLSPSTSLQLSSPSDSKLLTLDI